MNISLGLGRLWISAALADSFHLSVAFVCIVDVNAAFRLFART